MKWELKKYDDFIDFANGKSIVAEENGNYPVYGSNGIIGYTKEPKYENAVIIGRVGAYCGSIEYCKDKFWASDNTIIASNKDSSNIQFLYYFLKNARLNNYAGGSAQPLLTQQVLKRVESLIPDITYQEKIASILSAYDELIENNLKRIKLLEEAAQLLYRQWFVNFKFPGHEKTKFINGIPEGWEEKPLSEVCYLTMGQSPESIYYNQEGKGLPFHQGVTNFGFRFVTHEIYCTQENRIAEQGDILCSVRAPVGRLNISLDRIVIGRGLSAIRNKDGFQSFQYYQLKKYFFQEDLIGSGAIFASVTKKQMETIPLLTPTKDILSEFERIVKIYDGQIINLFYQNQRLKEARDILLPRLMDGSIEV